MVADLSLHRLVSCVTMGFSTCLFANYSFPPSLSSSHPLSLSHFLLLYRFIFNLSILITSIVSTLIHLSHHG